MSNVYVAEEKGKTEPMEVVHCKDEDKELQTILMNNFNLLAGDQISPEDPRRWMLIKREMPVPDPVTGANRWSIDFFFVDQDKTPTFVECKRYNDTRARREVVGQVLEYVANGQYYWNANDLLEHAEATAKASNSTLAKALGAVQSVADGSPDAFFKRVEQKLKASEIRIVFFLDEAPTELKRLVEFMNTQMGSVDVLLVEARQYSGSDVRIVVPTLYGFTEQIRGIKRAASAEQNRQPIATDWESFERNAKQRGLDEQTVDAMRKVYDTCKSLRADISWGRGTLVGSFSPKWPSLHSTTAPFSVCSNGRLDMQLHSFHGTHLAESFSARFGKTLLDEGLELSPEYQNKYEAIPAEKWVPHVDTFIAAFRDSIGEHTSQP